MFYRLCRVREISPGTHTFFPTYTCPVYCWRSVQLLDFGLCCNLIHASQPIRTTFTGQCFAYGFLQTSPRNDALAFSCILPTAGRIRDFHPLERAPAGRTTSASAAGVFRCGRFSVPVLFFFCCLSDQGRQIPLKEGRGELAKRTHPECCLHISGSTAFSVFTAPKQLRSICFPAKSAVTSSTGPAIPFSAVRTAMSIRGRRETAPSERRGPSHRPEEESGSRRLERTSLCPARGGQCHRQVSLFYKGRGRGSSDAGGSTGDMDDLVHKGPGIHGSFSCSLFLPHDTGRRSPGEVPAFSPNAKRPQRGLLLRTSFLSDVLLFWE